MQQQLESGDTTLNILITSEYQTHEAEMRKIIPAMNWLTKRRFLKEWQKYTNEYYKIKNLGILGPVMAIAPSVEALKRGPADPNEMNKWEDDRRRNMLRIIHNLLTISKNNKWL